MQWCLKDVEKNKLPIIVEIKNRLHEIPDSLLHLGLFCLRENIFKLNEAMFLILNHRGCISKNFDSLLTGAVS